MKFSTPGGERRASLLSVESVASFAGRFHVFLSSPRWARWGGVSLVLAGVIGFATVALLLIDSIRFRSSPIQTGGWFGWMESFLSISWPLTSVFVFLGLVGIFSLLGNEGELVWWVAVAGVAMAGIHVLSNALYSVIFMLREPSGYYSGFFFSETFGFLLIWSGPIGIVLVGIAALRARGFRVFRFLPIVIGVLSMPLISAALFRIYSGGYSYVTDWSVWLDVLISLPEFLSSLGWILFGAVMFGAKERGERIVARERRATEERNLTLTRRFYEEAWGNENLSVVDEIASEDFFDRRRNRSGSAAFKQAISDLHHAFPDMKAEIEEQTADNDTVATRCVFSGTDTGGVLWYPPTNETATFTGTFTDRFEDGKLTEHDGEMDEETLMEQLGLPSEK